MEGTYRTIETRHWCSQISEAELPIMWAPPISQPEELRQYSQIQKYPKVIKDPTCLYILETNFILLPILAS
jgi:hypothetical protein